MATANKDKQPAQAAHKTKISSVIDLLGRKTGASLNDMIETTSWQKHTVRAALTGLKKKGYGIERVIVEGVSRYSITKKPAAGAAK
ncbi:MAG: DUF3489 domain-containing protein [Marinomonas sp.]